MASRPPDFPYQKELDVPVVGLESEFVTWVDGAEVDPDEVWRQPAAFVGQPLLKRGTRSSQLPTGGAVYFDKGVIELVTPGIEIAPRAAARVVRNLWQHIAFIRDSLTEWERSSGHSVRLQGFSSHYNISFELPAEERNRNRTIQKLALLLAHLLPVPVILLGGNRRSTGVGVRPRRNRIEVTLDFTPDPGLMIATTALILGITREVMSWPSYLLSELDRFADALPAGVVPDKHTTRKGWLTKDIHFPRSPFLTDPDEVIWETRDGGMASFRNMGLRTALPFRHAIRRYSDPFTVHLVFGVLSGRIPSLLDLTDRPLPYDDVGRACRWGKVLPELHQYSATAIEDEALRSGGRRRVSDVAAGTDAPWRGEEADRRTIPLATGSDRRKSARRKRQELMLSRSPYEDVFVRLASGGRLRVGDDLLTPVAMKGWYHALFRRESDGSEQMLSIDQLLENFDAWQS